MFEICISNAYESDFPIALKNYQSSKKKIASENARTSKIFFLPLSNCVNTEIHA